MNAKNWNHYTITVNGLTIPVKYAKETVDELFLPLLQKLTDRYHEKQHRIVVFLAAPPAVGKTTLSLFLESLSHSSDDLEAVKAVGMDGFHYHADYLASHTLIRDGETVEMTTVKGCPETFDAEKLKGALEQLHDEDISWPLYFRNIHDVVEDGDQVKGNIILIEGNYLLLNEPRWSVLRQFCDYAVLIQADEELLKERLISRKMMGNKTREEAEHFYEYSDRRNIIRVLNNSSGWDERWKLLSDGDFQKV